MDPKAILSKRHVLLWLKLARRRLVSKFSVGGLMLGLWLATCALAASPQLHRLLHKDAQSPSHYCLFTQISQHLLAVNSGFVLAAKPEPLADKGLGIEDLELLPSFDYVVNHGRAPPSLFSSFAALG